MTDMYNEDFDNILVLNDANGNEVEMEYLDVIEYNGREYVVLLPVEEDADEVVILLIESYDEETDTEVYASVEDDETLNAVYELFKEKYKDQLNFAD